jgi:transglutaminase-like putative cysteine protease
MKLEAELWVSPAAGELRQSSQFMGMPVLVQRAELPPPGPAPQGGLFERTMKRIPAHPFALWVPELTVRWTGSEKLDLPEDAQQKREGDRRLVLKSAVLPSVDEAAELPVKGKPSAEDAPFLESTPLVPFKDPAFDGVLFRLAAREGASRWDLALKVNRFVFDWITEKDYSVGFASAAEVCRNPKGDCTEHGVLAVALLRRLGVPARGALGWAALGDTLALHFWVEVKLQGRWIPIDPTFDQAPASAFRVKLGTTDLANLASVGWDSAAQVFGAGQWVPEKEGDFVWGKGYYADGEVAAGPATGRLSLPGTRWSSEKGRLILHAFGQEHPVQATLRRGEASLRGALRLRSLARNREGWYLPGEKRLCLDLGGRWLEIGNLRENEALKVLESLEYAAPRR